MPALYVPELAEIAPPLLLANAVDYVRNQCADSEEIHPLSERYQELGRAEVKQALDFEDAVDHRGDLTVYHLRLDPSGKLINCEEDCSVSIAVPLREDEAMDDHVLNAVAWNLHHTRVRMANDLMAMAQESTDQDP